MIKEFTHLCFTYRVHFMYKSDETCGETDVNTKDVWINTRFSDDIMRETLFHELLHVVLEDCPMLESGATQVRDLEESMVRYISPRYLSLLQDNPWISDYIINKNPLITKETVDVKPSKRRKPSKTTSK